ncbi:MAG: ABC transporter ATP-binding protein [Synergistales bacterium]|nr:ABC transporter ATP-binding protein [Synergistales bacterium]
MALLEIRNVTKKFGALVANNEVSFSVEEGTIVGLIGPNGAGKTTLFNCISGFFPPTSGTITFDGRDVTGLPPHRVARLGAARTFQVVMPLQEMTVLDNVMVGSFLRYRNANKARERAMEMLDLCEMLDRKDHYAAQLTIAGKKRLEIARALATEPKLLMLDEAMAGLTSSEVKQAVELVKKLRDKGITLLLVEHIMEAVMPIADSMVVLDGGQKIAEDVPANVAQDERVIAAYLGQKFVEKQKGARGNA